MDTLGMKEVFWREIPSKSNPEEMGAIVDKHIDALIEERRKSGESVELHSYRSKDGDICMFLAEDGFPFPVEFARELLEHVAKKERPHGGVGRMDCRGVAERAVKAHLADGYFEIEPPSVPMRAYSFHAANYVEPQERRDKSDPRGTYKGQKYLAFDLTAGYDLNADREGGFAVLMIAADSKEKLKEYVREFYAGGAVEDKKALTAWEEIKEKWNRLSREYSMSINLDEEREGYPEFLTRLEIQLQMLSSSQKRKVKLAEVYYVDSRTMRVILYRTFRGRREGRVSLMDDEALAKFIGSRIPRSSAAG